jgi:hypothetical protein
LQVNSFWHPEYSDAQCDDPAQAFAAGWVISHSGTNFTPWTTFTSGAYLRYLPSPTTPSGGPPVSNIPRNPVPLSQLHEPTKDGLPDENAPDNCGEVGAAWVARDIGNEPDCDGDEIHDEVIGQGVVGGSDLLTPDGSALNPRYAAALAKRGVALSVFWGSQAQLVAKCHEVMALPAGDVLANFGGGANYLQPFSDPAHYNGFGHICVVAHSTTGGLMLMDPWIGAYRTYTDAQLEQMIVWGYIVVATPLAVVQPTPPPTPIGGGAVNGVPSGWRDDGTTLHAPNGTAVVGGIRLYVLNHVWDPSDVPVAPESYPALVEIGNPALGTGAVQWFEMSGQLSWTPAMNVFATWNGKEMAALRAALDAAQADAATAHKALTDAQASEQQAQAAAQAAEASLADAQRQIATLTEELAAAKNAPPPPAPVPVEVPAPPTPAQVAADALVAAIKAALGATAA